MTPDEETAAVLEAEACGAEIVECLSARPTGRMNDVADLAYAYFYARALLMRDTAVSSDLVLTAHRILERVEDSASFQAEKALGDCGRLKRSDG